ncbi:canopy family protein seele [Cochliomyia hominivorax]
MLKNVIVLIICVYMTSASAAQKFTSEQVKCHVCKAVVQEIEDDVSKVDPNKRVDVSGFRLDTSGNTISKSVPLSKSEMFLTEVMERVCDRMEDYLRATHKKTGKFMLMKIMVDGKMNPESSNVDFIQDEDLNKSLGHYCLEILEDHEEAFLKSFQSPILDEDLDIKICSEQAKYCKDAPLQEEYEFDDKDEL